MPSPMTISLQVPYIDNEQQFLVLAVQSAVRTFRRLNACADHELSTPLTSSHLATPSSPSTKQAQEALNER